MTDLPNFLMIGAPRTGSTALDAALRQHPDFFLPEGKETHFFSAGGDLSIKDLREIKQVFLSVEDEATYRDRFKGAASFSRRGEIDPSILYRAAYAIPRMQRYLDRKTQHIIVLRQPVERAYSHYRLHCSVGSESRPFGSYSGIVTPRTPHERIALDRYFGYSYYFESVRLFFEAFGREQFLVLLYDDLRRDPQNYMRTILEFLNADTRVIPTLTPETNAGLVPTTFWSRFRVPNHGLRRLLRSVIPDPVRVWMRHGVRLDERAGEGFKKPPLDPELRAELMVRYRDDILQTQDLIGRDLTHWL